MKKLFAITAIILALICAVGAYYVYGMDFETKYRIRMAYNGLKHLYKYEDKAILVRLDENFEIIGKPEIIGDIDKSVAEDFIEFPISDAVYYYGDYKNTAKKKWYQTSLDIHAAYEKGNREIIVNTGAGNFDERTTVVVELTHNNVFYICRWHGPGVLGWNLEVVLNGVDGSILMPAVMC